MSKSGANAQETKKKAPKKITKSGAKSTQKTPKKAQKVPIKNKKKKKERIDSISETVNVAQNALKSIEPPMHVPLRKAEMKFWYSIINEFSLAEWTDHTLEMAAFLCRNMYDLDLETRKMRREGSVLERKQVIPAIKDKDTKEIIEKAKTVTVSTYLNPRKQMIDTYTKNVIALRRNLSLHARATEGESRDVGARRSKSKDIENGMREVVEMGAGLIPYGGIN